MKTGELQRKEMQTNILTTRRQDSIVYSSNKQQSW